VYPTSTPPHPRAGIAVVLVLLATWLGAFGVALATGDASDEKRTAAARTAATR
jgi:hypothetical protein